MSLTMYNLTPARELHHARNKFFHYEPCEFHDPAGIPEFIAVLKEKHWHTGFAVLVCASSLPDLCAALRAQGRPPLPRRTKPSSPPPEAA
ncbi:hypothetical protein HDA32_000421 [Spinactinospora alkalitolerans]|uniref:Uncharacterized protein n=1 Tax=Spinactinospora alkalitolerans TaxID=687207 RepID=A0A852TPB8_9ACTN|nr:hypothetical protein [Spinactinospora alkalitolerans]NYE45301.1 hypothetical protein [Spinactinospora alkalitolerans]